MGVIHVEATISFDAVDSSFADEVLATIAGVLFNDRRADGQAMAATVGSKDSTFLG